MGFGHRVGSTRDLVQKLYGKVPAWKPPSYEVHTMKPRVMVFRIDKSNGGLPAVARWKPGTCKLTKGLALAPF